MDPSQFSDALAEPTPGAAKTFPLLKLPNELLGSILSYLPVHEVGRLNLTCRTFHKLISDDLSWKKRFFLLGLSHPGDSPFPFDTWRELYLAHYPYWFIPQRRIWFADGTELDGGFCGQLLLARYHPHTGNIECYALTGEQGPPSVYPWPERPGVRIHAFNPRVRLHLAQPVMRLRGLSGGSDGGQQRQQQQQLLQNMHYEHGRLVDSGRGLRSIRPAGNDLNHAHGVFAQVMLASAIAPHLQHPSMRLWPPTRIPAIDRVRRKSPSSVFSAPRIGDDGGGVGGSSSRDASSSFSSSSSVPVSKGTSFGCPTVHDDVCQSAFRFQRSVGGRVAALYNMLHPSGSMASGVATYATLPPDAYRPSPEKPYQGIWIGDYAAHGCEFLIVRQRVTKEEIRAGERIGPKHDGERVMVEEDEDEDEDEDESEGGEDGDNAIEYTDEMDTSASSSSSEEPDDDNESSIDQDSDYTPAADAASSSADPQHLTSTTAQERLLNESRRCWRPSRQRRPGRRRRFYSASESQGQEQKVPESGDGGSGGGQVGETGRLEAIKLTGDPNVPRGEFTFVAEDIGPAGDVYVAQSDVFKDKRAVQCWGHIAAEGFMDDLFIKTDLILVSHDVLAQHWHQFGHVAFYRRVDIDKYYDMLCQGDELQL